LGGRLRDNGRTITVSADAKKKCRQYSQEYLKFGFIASFANEIMPMCPVINGAMKPSKMKDHLGRVLKENIKNQPNLKTFLKAPGIVDCEG
ncbi:hypothetical protein T07_15168, partial [Trichinella nelsoni]